VNDERLPRSVYWRRRFVVLGIPALLVVALGLWLFNHGSGSATATPPTAHSTTATTATTAATTSAPPTSGVASCAPPALAVTIAADAADVPAGASPTFTITITNAGNTQCVVDAGELQREVVIVSGTDRIWSSKDCARPDSPARSLLLAPAATDHTQIAWNRVRSAPGCPAGQPAAKAGTYQASVTLAGTSGGPVVFRLG
jgi:hypothetical protein